MRFVGVDNGSTLVSQWYIRMTNQKNQVERFSVGWDNHFRDHTLNYIIDVADAKSSDSAWALSKTLKDMFQEHYGLKTGTFYAEDGKTPVPRMPNNDEIVSMAVSLRAICRPTQTPLGITGSASAEVSSVSKEVFVV